MKTALELFEDLRKNYDNDATIVSDIERLGNQHIQKILLQGAKQFYAKKYDCSENDIFLGDVKFRPFYWKNGVNFPYVVVVGSVAARGVDFYAQNLKAVLGEFDLTGATVSIPNLTYAKHLIVAGANIEAYNQNLQVETLDCNKCKQCAQIKDCMKQKAEGRERN